MNIKWIGCSAFGLCFLITSELWAIPSPSFNGSYFGAELGSSFAYANQKANGNAALALVPIFSSVNPYSLNDSMSKNAVAGSLFAGLGHTWNKFYLGGELALSNSNYSMGTHLNTGFSQNFDNLFIIQSTENMTTHVSVSPTQFGGFIRPGVLLTPDSLLYGRVGVSFATVNLNSSTMITKKLTVETTPVVNAPLAIQTNNNAHRAVFQIGAGLEQAINDKFTIRLDYLYSSYGTINANANNRSNSSLIELNGVLSGNSAQSVRLSDQSIMLGLAYHIKA